MPARVTAGGPAGGEAGGAAGARERIVALLAENAAHQAALETEHARIVTAADMSNADDEHDPEGATIAFEREQVSALLAQARATQAELEAALARVDAGTYGVCERCGGEIAPARLEARPHARTCVTCGRVEPAGR